MPIGAVESCLEKDSDQFPGEHVAKHTAAQADQVHVVVLDSLVRRKGFMNQAGPHARHLISDDTGTDATAADGHSAIHIPTSDCTGQRHNKIRIIVIRIRSAVAEIDYLMTGRAQPSDELFLQFKSAVVGGDTNEFRRPLQDYEIRHASFRQSNLDS